MWFQCTWKFVSFDSLNPGEMINEVISAALQVILFSLIPFLVYLIQRKSAKGFFKYIGLYPPTRESVCHSLLASLIFVLGGVVVILLNADVREIMITPPSVTGKLRVLGLGVESVLVLLVIAGIKTSLSEEILFRGFIAKRFVKNFGLQWGNFLQALVFALIHGVLFWLLTKAGIAFVIFIVLFSGSAGYVIGVINERKGNGSIVPGWIAHGLGNALSYFIIAFLI